jgi:hypothetical protein
MSVIKYILHFQPMLTQRELVFLKCEAFGCCTDSDQYFLVICKNPQQIKPFICNSLLGQRMQGDNNTTW